MHLSLARAGHSYARPAVEALYQRALSLPCSVGLTEAQQAKVIEQVIAARTVQEFCVVFVAGQ